MDVKGNSSEFFSSGESGFYLATRVLSTYCCFSKASFSAFLGAMPAVPQRLSTDSLKPRHHRRRYGSHKASSPDASIQLPQLPKQLEGKFVRGQMYKHQGSLPRLPVPPLEQTLRKYVEGIQVEVQIATGLEGIPVKVQIATVQSK